MEKNHSLNYRVNYLVKGAVSDIDENIFAVEDGAYRLSRAFPGKNFRKLPEYSGLMKALKMYKKAVEKKIIDYIDRK